MKQLVRDVMELCFPPVCAGCRGFSPDDPFLCPACKRDFDALLAAPCCNLCGMSLAYVDAPCAHCQGKGIAHYERVARIGKFDPPLKSLVHRLKYHRDWRLGELLADRLLKNPRVREATGAADCLLPVPLHYRRQVARGFNQAEVIAATLSRKCGLPVIHAVARRHNTPTQTHLHSRRQRMLNLHDAFELTDAHLVHRRNVIVVDDVYTTGATLQTLARALRPAKPASLSAIVLAVAEQKPHSFAASRE